MARRPAPEWHALTISVPRGQDGFWQIIRELDKSGPWSIAAVDDCSNTHRASVQDFVARLVKAGIVGIDTDAAGKKPTLYRLIKKPNETPRLRRDGSSVPPSGQQQMWVAMRSLQQFDGDELAYAASTPETKVDPVAARSYITRLHAAGYLAVVSPGKVTGGRAVWRFKPSMYTGPKAPQIMRTHFVFDPNRGAVVGDGTEVEEVGR